MTIDKVLPDLSRTKHMAIWHRALRQQWSAEDLDWSQPERVTDPRLKDRLARVLTPILMGEQAAPYSVSGLIPVLGRRAEVESQLYLEDRFRRLHETEPDGVAPARRSLHERLAKVLAAVPPMLDAVAGELDEIGIDRERLAQELGLEARRRLDRSMARGERLAADAVAPVAAS